MRTLKTFSEIEISCKSFYGRKKNREVQDFETGEPAGPRGNAVLSRPCFRGADRRRRAHRGNLFRKFREPVRRPLRPFKPARNPSAPPDARRQREPRKIRDFPHEL